MFQSENGSNCRGVWCKVPRRVTSPCRAPAPRHPFLSCYRPEMEEARETLEDALLFALDDLRGESFKRFKNKLRFLAQEQSAGIAWSRLEGADPIDTVQLLIEAYGKEGAREVATEVLRAVNLRDSATRLQQWKCNDCRKKYRRHIQERFGGIPEWGSRSGPTVSLCRRYTELLLARKTRPSERAPTQRVAVERKHWEMVGAHPEDDSPAVGMEDVLGVDAEGQSSRTVVLLGPAGVGKTTALWKLMLDWASGGKCWLDRFAYAFYISCGTVNLHSEPVSLVDMLLQSCPPGTLLTEDVLRNQSQVLLLVDGFDELNDRGLPGDLSSSDLRRKQAPANVVLGLLKRKLFAKCHLVVTTRPTALQSLQQRHLRSPQLVEVLGFCPAQRQQYFHHFFDDKEEAAQAFECVRRNEGLFSLCSLPVLCWILCSICRQKPQRDTLRETPEAGTVTDLHMTLLFSLWGHRSRPSQLEGLCSLARGGVLCKAVVFDEDVLRGHGLGQADLETLSASGRVLHQDAHLATAYRFTLLSFQEFFAALFYFVCADGSTIAPLKGLSGIFGNKKEHSSDYFLLVRFLFGLSNTKRLRVLQKTWGCKTFGTGLQQELLKWVEEGIERHSFRRGEQLLELCHCIYEAEDLELAKSIMGQVHHLDLQDQLSTKLDVMALSFCLSASEGLHSLRLAGCELETSGLNPLLRGLLKSSEIQLNRCGLSAAACKALASVLVTNQSLASLDLGENPLNDLGLIHLHEGLISARCKLQSLRLHRCNLTAAACEHLSSVLGSNQCLTELDLRENHLGDVGVRKLCEGLKRPQSRLQRLTLHGCGLTAAVCEDLASVLETSENLMELGLGDNELGDGGVRQLCTALGKPLCQLWRLLLTTSFLSPTTKKKLNAARAARPGLVLTSYYPPNFLVFPGEE